MSHTLARVDVDAAPCRPEGAPETAGRKAESRRDVLGAPVNAIYPLERIADAYRHVERRRRDYNLSSSDGPRVRSKSLGGAVDSRTMSDVGSVRVTGCCGPELIASSSSLAAAAPISM